MGNFSLQVIIKASFIFGTFMFVIQTILTLFHILMVIKVSYVTSFLNAQS